MPKYGESEAVKAVKGLIAEKLTTEERSMLAPWLHAKYDVRGYPRDRPSNEADKPRP